MKVLQTTTRLLLLTALAISLGVQLTGQARATQLDSLSLESGSGLVGFANLPLSPAFDPAVTVYNASMPFEHDTATLVSASAPFGYTFQFSAPSSFPPGATSAITIDIVEDDPFNPNPFPAVVATYTINVTRGSANTEASLSNLVVSGFGLSPAFDQLAFSYAVTVGFATSSITITPTAADIDSTITVDGQPVTGASSSPPISLGIGSNQIVILVTSADETVTKGYEILVTRMEQDSDNDQMDDYWESQNNLNVGIGDGHLDHDKDGQKNLFEYAFGSDPCDPLDKALPQVAMDGSGYATLSYFEAITDGSIIYIPEVTDPEPNPVWTSDFIDLTLPGSPQNKVWRDNPSGGGSPPKIRFFRVRIESAP